MTTGGGGVIACWRLNLLPELPGVDCCSSIGGRDEVAYGGRLRL